MLVYYSNMEEFRKQVEMFVGIRLSDEQVLQFQRYEQELCEWNQRINLTAIKTSEEIRRKHFLDSLFCTLAWKDRELPKRCIDIGTGAGFPGIPLHIVFPHIHMTLVESIHKKALFCEHIIKKLNLTHIDVLSERAEVLGTKSQYVSSYDCVVARAVASLSLVMTYALPLVTKDGVVVAMKGNHIEEEMKGINEILKKNRAIINNIIPYVLPHEQDARNLVLLSKPQ